MDDLLEEFLTETNEGLETLDSELVDLERRPDDPELIGNIFRVLHTIKGTSGFLDLPRLEAVAHAGENVLSKFRDGELEITPAAVGLIFEAMDAIKNLVAGIAETGKEPDGDDSDLIERLNEGMKGNFGDAPAAPAEDVAVVAAETPVEAEVPAEAEEVVEEDDGTPLYERVGGLSSIDAITDAMCRHANADDRLTHIFEAGDIDIIQGAFRDYLCDASRNGSTDGAQTLEMVFADLGGVVLADRHFDALFAHFSLGMAEMEIEGSAMTGLAQIFEKARELIVAGDAGSTDTQPEAAAESEAPADVEAIEEVHPEASEPDVEDEPAVAAKPAGKEEAPAASEKEGRAGSHAPAQSLRVNVDVLENLMTVVSELVLTRNQIMQIHRDRSNSELDGPLQRLNQVTSELQESVMKTRMQPIGNAWNKLPRIIRDLASELHKKIELEMDGADTELDRQILEQIKDPLTHMVRNSGDHGLETPAERVAAGKPETGTVKLSARHEGGHIIIEITDDGRGIPVDKIRAKSIEKGLTTEAEAANLTDQQILQFIFKPGFSTAEKVTNVSGRGVGMDVVRTNIANLGGTVDLSSVEGKGSRFTIKIPLTLAIVQALIVQSGGERFAIPQNAVTELVRVSKSSEHQIERINNASFLRLRDRLLPLVSLKGALKLTTEMEQDENYVVVFQVGSFVFGVAVTQVFDTEEIVVKPVARNLRQLKLFSGNTILGDGSVVMILDANGVASLAGNATVDHDEDEHERARHNRGVETAQMLLFRAGTKTPKAFPLELVARIEEIEAENIEFANGGYVTQYRGSLMPLVPVDGAQPIEDSGTRPVLVFSEDGHSLGVVVDEIVDIAEHAIEFESRSTTPGVLGSTVIGGRATDVLDASHYLRMLGNDWFSVTQANAARSTKFSKRVLLVDDSPFFRNLLSPMLRSAGYAVTMAESAEAAMAILEKESGFHAIVSDIEMPGMGGLEFATTLRSGEMLGNTRLLALSSYDAPQHIAQGLEAGFDDYITKADHESLIETLARWANAPDADNQNVAA